MNSAHPRLVLAGTGGDSGKTLVSIGLLVASQRDHQQPAAFKKGPDYIDAAWLSLAAGRPCYNLDTFLQPPERILAGFASHASSELNVIEGNRGFLDGSDAEGTHSTATLAELLQAPVVLVLSARKMTRTVAATVLGCRELAPRVHLAGVVLNRVASARQERVIRAAVEQSTGVPVVGAIPNLRQDLLPDRHLGLVPPQENPQGPALLAKVGDLVVQHVDCQRLWRLAGEAAALGGGRMASEDSGGEASADVGRGGEASADVGRGGEVGASAAVAAQAGERDNSAGTVRIGVFSDSAFTFYYPDNWEALREAGAELVFISGLSDRVLPAQLHGLYLGGGFPETHADRLAMNVSLHREVKAAVEGGMPVYAECGGMIFLSQSLRCEEREYPMAGVLPLRLQLERRPQGHGYMEVEATEDNPFFPPGQRIRGHEFHYTRVVEGLESSRTGFRVLRGTGCGGGGDGVIYKNALAGYMHIHALGVAGWAPALVKKAGQYREQTA